MSERLITLLITERIVEGSDAVKLRYGLAAIKSEAVKTLLLLALFQRLGLLAPFTFLLLLTIPLRMSTGGIHVESSVKCFVLSFAFFLAEIVMLPQIPLHESQYSAIMLLSIAVIVLMPPVPSPKRPIKTKKRYITNKAVSCVLCILWGILLQYFITDYQLVRCGIWAFLMQATEVSIVNVIRDKGRIKSYV